MKHYMYLKVMAIIFFRLKIVSTDVADISSLTNKILTDLHSNFANVENILYSYKLDINGRFDDIIIIYTNAIQFVNVKFPELEQEELVRNSTVFLYQEVSNGLETVLNFTEIFDESMTYIPIFMDGLENLFKVDWFEIRTTLSAKLLPCINSSYSILWRMLVNRSYEVRNCLRISFDTLRYFYYLFSVKMRQVEIAMAKFASEITKCYNPTLNGTFVIDCVLNQVKWNISFKISI